MPTLHFCISTATFLDNKWRPAFFIAKRFGVHCCTWQLLIFTFCPVRCWQRFDLQMETHYCFDWLIDCMLIPIMKMRKSQLPRTFSICFNRNEPTSYPGSYLRWPPRPTSSMLARSRAWDVCGVWCGVRGAGCGCGVEVWLWAEIRPWVRGWVRTTAWNRGWMWKTTENALRSHYQPQLGTIVGIEVNSGSVSNASVIGISPIHFSHTRIHFSHTIRPLTLTGLRSS